jgi:hypothetical protein
LVDAARRVTVTGDVNREKREEWGRGEKCKQQTHKQKQPKSSRQGRYFWGLSPARLHSLASSNPNRYYSGSTLKQEATFERDWLYL